MNKDELLEQLSMLQLQELIHLIKIGEATAAHHSVIRGLLKDNGVEVNQQHKEGNPIDKMLDAISNKFEEFEE